MGKAIGKERVRSRMRDIAGKINIYRSGRSLLYLPMLAGGIPAGEPLLEAFDGMEMPYREIGVFYDRVKNDFTQPTEEEYVDNR